ncbi:MAG: ShlB/FhaC/HecB family hemolysin secretion/activation protein [Sphaerospermopsis sp. SIO1G2]|nr:ShlB/FhaC/HecB family hemolysin secretion/activation protein [Sphaerospermopsis sp. SIO1G2]
MYSSLNSNIAILAVSMIIGTPFSAIALQNPISKIETNSQIKSVGFQDKNKLKKSTQQGSNLLFLLELPNISEPAKITPRQLSSVESFKEPKQQKKKSVNIAANPDNTEYCPSSENQTNLDQQTLEISVETANNSEIANIRILGNSLFTGAEIQEIIKSVQINNQNSTALSQNLIDAINQHYQQNGYITSKAKQIGLNNSTLEIQLIEGSLTEIKIQGRKRLNLSYICNRLRLGIGTPFNAAKLEDQLKLLRIDPQFKQLDASLRPTQQEGKTNLVVTVKEASFIQAKFGVNNYSPPRIGSEQFKTGFTLPNVTGMGDTFNFDYYRSFSGGSNQFAFNYQIPVNAMDGKIQLRANIDRQKTTQSPFDELDIKAEKEVYEISYTQPFIKTPREEFGLSLGFTLQDGQTFLFDDIGFGFGIGPDENGNSRTRTINFGQYYISRGQSGAWSLSSQFNLGVGIFDATENAGAIPDGRFFSWLGQIQRVQILDRNNFLLITANAQLTPDSLLPFHQFTLGGGRSVRGYRENVRSADNGFSLSIEDRITLFRNNAGESQFQVAPFVDMGLVWNNSENPNQLDDQTFLISGGLGLMWTPNENTLVRIDWGIPFIDLDDRGENIQDDGIHFTVEYRTP